MTNATAEMSPAEELPEAPAFPPHRAKIAGSDWFDYEAVVDGDDVAQRRLQVLRESLASVVSADQLVILAGLGTSLGLQRSTANGDAEDVAAPTMGTLFTEVAKLAGFEKASVIAPDSIERRGLLKV